MFLNDIVVVYWKLKYTVMPYHLPNFLLIFVWGFSHCVYGDGISMLCWAVLKRSCLVLEIKRFRSFETKIEASEKASSRRI